MQPEDTLQTFAIQPETATIFAAASITLFMKGLVLSYLQVRWRVRGRAFERPEDARLLGLPPRPEPDVIQRVAGAWRNELENTPAFMSLAAGFVLLGGAPSPLLLAAGVYVGSRSFQAFAQIKALQPHRTIGFLGGVLASAYLAVMTGMRVWSAMV